MRPVIVQYAPLQFTYQRSKNAFSWGNQKHHCAIAARLKDGQRNILRTLAELLRFSKLHESHVFLEFSNFSSRIKSASRVEIVTRRSPVGASLNLLSLV